jgi:hypothetical protein
MADYYSTTIIQPDIPLSDMTATEYLLLCGLFQHEVTDGKAYFFTDIGPSDMPEFGISELKEALAADAGRDTQAARWLQDRLDHLGEDMAHVTVDMSTKSYEFIFQDIIRRSESLTYVWVVTSYQCSKLRPDGFGGAASVITADQFRFKSTDDLIDDFLTELFPHGDTREPVV